MTTRTKDTQHQDTNTADIAVRGGFGGTEKRGSGTGIPEEPSTRPSR